MMTPKDKDKDEAKLEQLAKNLFKLKPKPRQELKKGGGKKKKTPAPKGER